MRIERAEKSFFRGKDKEVRTVTEGYNEFVGFLGGLVPVIEAYVTILPDFTLKRSTFSEITQSEASAPEYYKKEEINKARIRGHRGKRWRKPEFRFVYDQKETPTSSSTDLERARRQRSYR